jgi:murein DD-endopeptidase MepM/ murein hydrolase activator NlpD
MRFARIVLATVWVVASGIAAPAAMADTFTMKVDTYFKKTTAQSSSLPASDKCFLRAGQAIGAVNKGIISGHWQITLAGSLSGCSFTAGYVFADHVTVSGNASGYTYPLPSGVLGSGWCVCRSVGTSPHIGQDTYTNSGTMRAVAVHSGVVESVTFDASCGYFVSLRDDRGALWRYVHLNQPGVSQGARVTNGQQLATISAYPQSACGTGPHLHWERRAAGPFGDSATGKDCGQGYRSCYYDPVKPWRTTLTKMPSFTAFTPIAAPIAATTSRSGADAMVAPTLQCKNAPSQYARVDIASLAGLSSAASAGIDVSLRYVTREGRRVAVAGAAFVANPKNVCDADRGRNCIVSWTLLNQSADGHWRRVFQDPAVFNKAPARLAEEAACAADAWNGRSVVVMRDLNGRRYVTSFDSAP